MTKAEFDNDANYKLVYESKVHGKSFYVPSNLSDYHLSRQMAGNAQNIYGSGGATKDVLDFLMDKMLDMLNNPTEISRLRTDLATICNNIKYRLRYPVDEECGLRLGAIYVFIEGENPNVYSLSYTKQKEMLAKGDVQAGLEPDPDLYTFFLTMGIGSMESWQNLSEDLKSLEYLSERNKILKSMMPPNQ